MKSTQSKRTIEVYFEALTPQAAKTIVKALQPESATSHAFGSRVHISRTNNRIQLIFETNRTSTSRAITNSYLRWIQMMMNSIKILDEEPGSWE